MGRQGFRRSEIREDFRAAPAAGRLSGWKAMAWSCGIRPVIHRFARYRDSFSVVGLVFAALFFSASVSPSLIPRPHLVQGLLSGVSIALGYAVGVGLAWAYRFLELKPPTARVSFFVKWGFGVLAIVLIASSLWQMAAWQNSVRELMEMPPLTTSYPVRVLLIAVLTGIVLIILGRLFRRSVAFVSRQLQRFVPPRLAHAAGFVLVVFGLLVFTNDLIVKKLLKSADESFLKIDEFVDDHIARPSDPRQTGSEASLVPWESIGQQGKHFLVGGPTRKEIADFTNLDAEQPIRVYVGKRSRPTIQERAELALEELIRVGGFEKSLLVVATPTGTGWLDPSAVDTLEYLHRGDTAIVSVQYSYLPSWITLQVDPQAAAESAAALFDEIYSYWKTLPVKSRPKLYLHGLSLGALGSELSADLYTIFEEPIQGAVWSGPPFPSQSWRRTVNHRNEGTPIWLPEFRDGRMVRFTSQHNTLDTGKPWGPTRIVYVQYASDPMIWFSKDLAWTSPEWLEEPRGSDVSPQLRWYPLVTFLQIAGDLPMATSVPLGYGHNYSPSSYIDAWIAVTEPTDWTEEKTARLKEMFRQWGIQETPKP